MKLKHSLLRLAVRSAGFTMIELLVVIAIIGILAVALLGALNPLEQIARGKDTGLLNSSRELIAATERYYASQSKFPWTVARLAANPFTAVATNDLLFQRNGQTGDGPDWNWMYNMSDTADVKATFVDKTKATTPTSTFLIHKAVGETSQVFVCFKPTSTRSKTQAAADCDVANTTSNTLTKLGTPTIQGTTVCATTDGSVSANNYICIP